MRPRMLSRATRLFTLLALFAATLAAAVGGTQAASSSVTVTLNVASATTLNTAGCTGAALAFGTVLPATKYVTTADCQVLFGSTNDSSSLHLRQADSRGSALYRPTSGALDPTFDGPSGTGNGIATLDLATNPSWETHIEEVREQPDGNVLAAGYRWNGSFDEWVVARLLPSGALDPTFDGDSGTGNGIVAITTTANEAQVDDILLNPDGTIVLVGNAYIGPTRSPAFAKLLPDGRLDVTFDGDSGTGNGVVQVPVGGGLNNYADHAVLQPDGKIATIGYGRPVSGPRQAYFLRLNPNGTLDTTFDGPSGTGNGAFHIDPTANDDYPNDIALQDDGAIVVGGSSCPAASCSQGWLIRVSSTGALDTTFDGPSGTGNGIVVLDLLPADDEWLEALAVLDDGDIAWAGARGAGATSNSVVARMTTTGAWDTGFDGNTGTGNGLVVHDLASGAADDYTELHEVGDGRLMLVGGATVGAQYDTSLTRVEADGRYDTEFDQDGARVLAVTPSDDSQRDASFASDGDLLIAGSSATLRGFVVDLAGGTVSNYATGGPNWSSGTDMFGACLASLTGTAVTDVTTWAVGSCTTTDGTGWNAVPAGAAGSRVAKHAGAGTSTAALRFGVRASATATPGRYVAPITVEVLAPSA